MSNNTTNNLIEIKDKYLIFRDQATILKKEILERIKEKNNSEISLDFSRVHFISRSFVDELLKIINYFQREQGREVKIINKNFSVNQLFNIVKKRKEKTLHIYSSF